MIMETEKDIRGALKAGNFVLGTNSVLKAMKNGRIESVIYASNCPESTKSDLNYYNKVSGVVLKEFGENSLRLGEFCGKPFNILLFGITAAKKKGKVN
jgi:large subunit ribosomal protein L30e